MEFSEEEILKYVNLTEIQAKEFFEKKQYKVAAAFALQILKINPDNLTALKLLALIAYQHQKIPQAIEYFKTALKYHQTGELHNNIALAYSQIGEISKAITHLKKALEINSSYHFHSNLGLQYLTLRQYNEAIQEFKESLELHQEAKTWAMLGSCYAEQHDLEKAELCFKQALELDPNFANAHCSLANIYQLKGEWEKSWSEYEWRFENYSNAKEWLSLFNSNKKWQKENLTDKKILLFSEQGIGDSIHFFRYVPLVKKLGAYVIIHCPDTLEPLYKPYVDEIFTQEPTALKDLSYDYFASLMSLPYLLNNPPIPKTPYLFTNKKIDFSQYTQFKIGIVWAGNPQHPNDRFRSCFLKEFSPIQEIPNVKLFSLQKDIRLRQYRLENKPIDLTADCNFNVVDLKDELTTFEDTANVLKAIDLLISVDTSVVHLAGALDVPTWVLLPYNTDWRWKLTGTETEWYKSLKLFRQKTLGNWAEVFQEMKKELLDLVKLGPKVQSITEKSE